MSSTETIIDTVVKKSSETVETDEKGNSAVVHPIETENEEMVPVVKSDKQYGVIEPVDDDSIAMAEPRNDHDQDSVTKQENEDSKSQLECDLKPQCEHLTPNSLLPENQVSEFNPSLGSQVKSDSVSCNQKNTIIANGDKLEQEIVRSKMVEEPSSRIDVPVYDESHLMDVEEPDEKKVSVEENSGINRGPNLNLTNSNEDVGYPEKLNLDGNSDDESMDEDMPESKQFDSKFNNELVEKGESVEITNVKEHDTVVVRDGLSSEGGDYHNNDIPSVSLVKKHKFPDQASVENNNPAKRQRWNSEPVKGSNIQRSTIRPATAPMGESISLKCNFSWSDSPAIDAVPNERIVPPSQWPPTNSLRIDGFLRPFTLNAVQGLLGKTGKFTSFWMDEIKTHCYVSYTTVEEAVATRNAVYNLQWPPNVGHLLVAEYVEPEDVKMKLEPPPPVDFGNNDSVALPHTQQLMSKLPPAARVRFPPPPSLSMLPPAARERFPPPPSLSMLPLAARERFPSLPSLPMLPPAARERFPPRPSLSMLPPAAREKLPPPPPLTELPPPPPLTELPPPPREWLPLSPPREWLPLSPPRELLPLPPPRELLPVPPPSSNLSPDARERIPLRPPLPKKVNKPIVTIDDVFRKTRATPRIYYLPLSDEQVAAKLAAMDRSVMQ